MSEMIKRVSKAMADHMQAQVSFVGRYDGDGGEVRIRTDDEAWIDMVELARVAVSAMRVPTEKMEGAAYDAADKSGWADDCRGCPEHVAKFFYQWMIDSALGIECEPTERHPK